MHTTNHMLLIEDSNGDVIDGHDTCSAHCCKYLAEKLGVRNRDSVLMGYSGETEFNTICEVCNVVIHGTEGLGDHEIKCSNYRCEVCNKEEETEEEETEVDLGDLCVHCENDTSFGSGRFVDRYPLFWLERDGDGIEYTGYCCNECEIEFQADHDAETKREVTVRWAFRYEITTTQLIPNDLEIDGELKEILDEPTTEQINYAELVESYIWQIDDLTTGESWGI